MISSIWAFVLAHGLMLLAGGSAMLLAGAVAAWMPRSPLHRQRIGEMTLLCTLVWLLVACVPLPRWHGWVSHRPQETAPAESHPVIDQVSASTVIDRVE